MHVGSARASTHEQPLGLQHDALTQADCERLFTETVSAATAERQGLTEALDFLRPGDTLVVWRLERLGRSLRHLIELVFHILGALAEFERDLIRERTQAGLAAARAEHVSFFVL